MMHWRNRHYIVLLLLVTATAIWQIHAETNEEELCDDIQQQCRVDQYLATVASENDCWSVCSVDEMMSSSGSGGHTCQPCDTSCTSCYGRLSSQCYSCVGYFVTLIQAESPGTIDCTNGTIRNTSLEVRNCISECLPNSTLVSGSNECVCSRGFYLNADGSKCLKCVDNCDVCINNTQSGCLQCSRIMHNEQCLAECPSGFVDVNGVCEEAIRNDLFPLSSSALYAIIGGIGFIILFCAFWISCVAFIYCIRQKRKDKYMLSTEGATTISESFKKVARNISVKRRPPRHDHNAAVQRQHIVSQSYDPYLQTGPSIDNEPAEEPVVRMEMTNLSFQPGQQRDTHEEEEEEFYMQMTPAGSIEDIHKNQTFPIRAHKKVSKTQSFQQPSSNTPQYTSSHRNSVPAVSGGGSNFVEDEQEVYINPEDLLGGESQENYVAMDFREGVVLTEPEEYLDPSDLVLQNSQTEEQELYMEMEQPPVPNRGVILPAGGGGPPTTHRQGQQRKETMDNQYVRITGQDQRMKNYLSDERLNPKYINVQRHGDPRLRSVTSPVMSGGTHTTTTRNVQIDEQPIYQNYADDEEDNYYGNVHVS